MPQSTRMVRALRGTVAPLEGYQEENATGTASVHQYIRLGRSSEGRSEESAPYDRPENGFWLDL